MPSKEILGANTISPAVLLPHLRKKRQSVTVAEDKPGVTAKVYIAGENISKGNAVSVGTDSKIYKATNVYSDDKRCYAIATQDAISGGTIRVETTGIITSPAYSFVSGDDVFVSSGGQLTTDKPSVVSGNIVQKVGKATSTNVLFVSIDPPMVFK